MTYSLHTFILSLFFQVGEFLNLYLYNLRHFGIHKTKDLMMEMFLVHQTNGLVWEYSLIPLIMTINIITLT